MTARKGRHTPHTRCARMKRVMVKLVTGQILRDRFLRRSNRFVWLKDAGKLAKRDICAFFPIKEKTP